MERAAAGAGALYLLTGEPGIGKSRLAAEVAAAARGRGLRVAWGRCWEAGGAPVFWPWREVIEGLGIRFPDAIAAGDPAEARFALFRAVTAALAGEAAREPLLVVLEDLHAADRSTLLLLEFAASQVRGLPILILGTYRDLEAKLRADAADAIAGLGRVGQILQLARLRRPEVVALVRDAIEDAGDALAAAIFEMTAGNPLFVDEVVRDVRARGGEAGLTVPLGVREIIRQRLAALSADARRVLEAGSVLGVELGAAELDRIVDDAPAVIEEAARNGLVGARDGRIRFTHALYREALYHDLPRERRQQLHREAARALTATSAPLAEIAHHLLESGADAATEAVAHAIRAAGLAAEVFAYEDAAVLLDRARLAIGPGPMEALLRARVMIALGEIRLRSGDVGGRALCVEAAEVARRLDDAELLARAGLAYGSVFTTLGVDPVLVGLLEDALARQPDQDSALRARLMARLAAARQPAVDGRDRDIQLGFDAVAMARRVGDRRELLAVLHSATGVLYGAVNPAIRLPLAREQEHIAEELGDLARLVQARGRLAMDHLELGDFASYAKLADSYEQVAARIGRAAAPWRTPLMRSMLALAGDRFAESERWQEESRQIENERPAARRAQDLHRVGFLRAAERHAELGAALPELRSLWLQTPYGPMIAEPRVLSCLARLGADAEVRAGLDQVTPAAMAEAINATALAEAIWLAGTADEARAVRAVLAPYAEVWMVYWLDCDIVEGPAGRLLAYLHGVAGDWDECDRCFARALRAVEAAGRRGLAARMRFELGDLMVRADRDRERARALLAEGRAGATVVGLPELVALIDRRHLAAASAAAPPPREAPAGSGFAMELEGEYYAIAGSSGPLHFKATRGMHYLAQLVDRPGVDVHVLELAGAGEGVDRGDAGELLDGAAFRAYRDRLQQLREAADEAEALGNAERADLVRAEMEAIAGEISRATGRGGRGRRGESVVDRARSAVQRRIKDALDRVTEQDPGLGAWLRRTVRTGNYCSFRPKP